MRIARCGVVVMAGIVMSVSASQDGIYSDGFEIGHACRWSRQVPVQECGDFELAVMLPGGVVLEMVLVPGGTFMMGSPLGEEGRYDDEDLHEVTLTSDFYLGKTEVTQAQWEAVMGTAMPASCGSGYGVGPGFPAYCLSWHDVAGPGGFVETLNSLLGTTAFRLPTEAEAERAMRANSEGRFSHGDALDPPCDDQCGLCDLHDEHMVWCGNDQVRAEPAGSRMPNAYGLYDTHGDLWEWVQDWYTYHLGSGPQTDPNGPSSGSSRVMRGGHWDELARDCRSAKRDWAAPGARSRGFGFRLARDE